MENTLLNNQYKRFLDCIQLPIKERSSRMVSSCDSDSDISQQQTKRKMTKDEKFNYFYMQFSKNPHAAKFIGNENEDK